MMFVNLLQHSRHVNSGSARERRPGLHLFRTQATCVRTYSARALDDERLVLMQRRLASGSAPGPQDRAEWRSAAAPECRVAADQHAALHAAVRRMPLEGPKNRSSFAPAYAALSFRLARLALMILTVSTSPDFLCVQATMSTRPAADRPRRRTRRSWLECRTSGPSSPLGFSSHSNTYLSIYINV
jgi:hypothetical protein